MTKKNLLDGCSATLEFFLVKYILNYFCSNDTIFSTFTKNALKVFKLKKKFKINFLVAPNVIF